MQALFQTLRYTADMTAKPGNLRALREKAGLTLRELARLIDEHPSNVSYWERTDSIPRSDVLLPIAKALGVSVEDLLGENKPHRPVPGGKARLVFDAVSRLPRRQQQKIVEVVEALVAQAAS